MEHLFRSVDPGVHCYSPFSKTIPDRKKLSLSYYCRKAILKCITIKRLASSIAHLPLPKLLLNYIAELSTFEFELIETAPFNDAFSVSFLYRALTYKVKCLIDEREYLLSFGYSSSETEKLRTCDVKWIRMQHKNVMSVCATAVDPETGNVFLVYNKPRTSLEQMWAMLLKRNFAVLEVLFVRLAIDVCEALKYILCYGLQYKNFGLKNIFIVDDELVLENGLMRKCLRYSTVGCDSDRNDEQVLIREVMRILRTLLENYDEKLSFSMIDVLVENFEKQNELEGILRLSNREIKRFEHLSLLNLIEICKS